MLQLKSQIARKLLNYFFINPDQSLYVNELERTLGLDKRNLVKKLKEFELEGILKSTTTANLKLYSINKNYPLFEEYRKIILKTVGFEGQLNQVIQKEPHVTKAYLYGSYAHNKMQAHSDIDLLVVGDHSIISLQKKINRLQHDTGREINVVSMSEEDFKERAKKHDPFLSGILKNKYILITPKNA